MDEDLPLYQTEAEIARSVMGRANLPEWKALAIVLERHGLPKIDPQFGRRYWPAVRQFFDRRNAMIQHNGSQDDVDMKKWNEGRSKKQPLVKP